MAWRERAAMLCGAAVAVGLTGYLGVSIASERSREVFLPGQTSAGHYQIELACESCHTKSFASADDLQEACVRCHGAQLERARDSHPKSKFTDPRNADRLAVLDARACVTCHSEHRPASTDAGGVTLAADHCYGCHSEVSEERPSHQGADFASCAQSGCHNFHDNRALYEDFLVAHQNEPPLRNPAILMARTPLPAPGADVGTRRPLAAADHDAPPFVPVEVAVLDEWALSAHARGGVNCSDCHGAGSEFRPRVELAKCQECHEGEAGGFLAGRHGMRLAAGLSPMRPGLARLPMKSDAADRELGCSSCHGGHAFETRWAAVEACLECHDDEHSRSYEASAHAALWRRELAGAVPPGSGVTCATCHLPRESADGHVVVHHDQNANLRPSDEMGRAVCSACHGTGFTMDALADAALVRRCFTGAPQREVESLEWVARRERDESRTDPEQEEVVR